MIVCGVDPGKTGGLAIIEDGGVRVAPMPIVPAKGGKGRDEYDVRALVRFFDSLGYKARGDVHVLIERLHPMPMLKGGTIANYNRGASTHLLIGICAALGQPYTLVLPQVWQRAMLAGTSGADTKQRSVLAAQRLFPGVSLLPTERSRKPSDGLADALLIAEYGRRQLAGDRGAQRGLLEAAS